MVSSVTVQAAGEWSAVQSWVYQLCNYKDDQLKEIAESEYAKSKSAGFKVVPQNCPELYTWSPWKPKLNEKYIKAIDGLGLESVFYRAHDKPANQSWCQENRANALAIRKAGKLVLGVDYAKKPASIEDAYRQQRALGFIPYVSVEALDRIQRESTSSKEVKGKR